ncbi:MAG: hypothetical protein K6E59_01310 [Bacilli bacterium]|nr:hypothetical protein [Bacilli bacterium]
MITKGFCDRVSVQLSILHLSQDKIPSANEIRDAAIVLLFKAEAPLEAVNVAEAYRFLAQRYAKVQKAMNSPKWTKSMAKCDVSGLFPGFLIPEKRKVRPNLIYVTDYFSSGPRRLSLQKDGIHLDPFMRNKSQDAHLYDIVSDNGFHYMFEKGSTKKRKKKEIDFGMAVARFTDRRVKGRFFVMIELFQQSPLASEAAMAKFQNDTEMAMIAQTVLLNLTFGLRAINNAWLH